MADRFILGLSSSINITTSTDADEVKEAPGTLKTDTNGTFLQMFDNELNLIPLAGNQGTTIVKIFSQSDFPAVVAGKIPLANLTKYILCASVTITNPFSIPDGATVSFESLNRLGYRMFVDIGDQALFNGDDIEALEVLNTVFIEVADVGSGVSTLLNLSSTSNTSFINVSGSLFFNFKSLGTADDLFAVSLIESAFRTFQIGMVITDVDSVVFREVGWEKTVTPAATCLTIEGTASSVTISGCLFNIGEAINITALDIDSSSVVSDGRVSSCSFVETSGSQFLNPTGKDQTDINWDFQGNGAEPDSETFGEFSMNSNATETVIVAQNTPVKIAGTTVVGNLERMTHINGRLTYIGKKNIIAKIFAFGVASVNANNEGDGYTVYIFKNGVLQSATQMAQTFGVALNNPNVVLTPTCLIPLITNDFVETFVENNSISNENVLFPSLRMMVFV